MRTIEKIEKECVGELVFSKREVLDNPESKKHRFYELHRAQLLGNVSRSKVSIIFETAEGSTYQVNTTVWAVGSEFITLKGGVVIPISSVVEVV